MLSFLWWDHGCALYPITSSAHVLVLRSTPQTDFRYWNYKEKEFQIWINPQDLGVCTLLFIPLQQFIRVIYVAVSQPTTQEWRRLLGLGNGNTYLVLPGG
jgi:hypothetical protein